MVVIYPPVAMLFASKEKEMYYGKCMEIRKGQTVAEVLATMAQFQISTQTSNALAFNTPEFSADVCYVRFTDEPVPRVKSVEFLVD